MQTITQILLGLLLSALIGYFGYRRHSLSKSGVFGAMLVGTAIFGFGGWAWGILLIVFFVSSSALSHFKASRKESLAEKFSKGSQRDLAQALANGGAGALIAIANFLWPHPLWWAAFVGAMATVNADTWATELGVLSKAQPRLVTNGKLVEVGTSGGITLLGTSAALAGSALIGLFASAFTPTLSFSLSFSFFLLSSLSGLFGSLFDSFLGATVQAIYFCDNCHKETERHPTHTCGHLTRSIRGWRWLDNDWVNFVSSAVGGWLLVVGSWWLVAGG
jgi:uncharacterized protein (TIGR00297 family)